MSLLVSILLEFGYGEKGKIITQEGVILKKFQSFLNLDMGKKRQRIDFQRSRPKVSILLEFGYGEKGKIDF